MDRVIRDVTPLARGIQALLASGDLAAAEALLPEERPYPLSAEIAARLAVAI